MLDANSLGGERRSPWYDCGNWQLGAFSQDCAPARPAETGGKRAQTTKHTGRWNPQKEARHAVVTLIHPH